MMPELVPVEEQGRLSGFGTAIGYVGSIVGVLLVMPFFNGTLPVIGKLQRRRDARAALARSVHAARRPRVGVRADRRAVSAVLAAAVLLLPRPQSGAARDADRLARRACAKWVTRIRDARQHPGALRFIIASFVYQDAIGTIVGFMTLYAVKAVGFDKGSEITLFLVLTIPSIFGSYIYGHLVDRIGAKRSLMMTLVLWIVLLAVMIAVPGKNAFWLVGLAIGLNFGGVPTAERPVLLGSRARRRGGSLFQPDAAVVARGGDRRPAHLGAHGRRSRSRRFGTAIAYRAAVMTVALMFVIAAFILRGVPDRSTRAA